MGDAFDVKFKLLPPELQARLWVLGLDADTSKVNIAYKTLTLNTGLAYNYAGNVEAFMAVQRMKATVGVNPSNGNFDLGVVYRGFKFGASASATQKSGGASIGYGTDLLPFPSELATTFSHANGGLLNMAGDIQAAPNNPLAWYNLHSNDVATISQAAKTIQDIAKRDPKSSNFGAGLRVYHTPQSGLTIYGGVQFSF